MRILLDAKDLIDVVEHSKPLKLSDFDDWLRMCDVQIVYSLGNIRGLAAPLGIDNSHLPRIKDYLTLLERLPHCFIASDIDLLELRRALDCFEVGKEYESVDPYVPRFDYVFPRFANPARLFYPMYDSVPDLWRACPQIFKAQPNIHRVQAFALSLDRERMLAGASFSEPPSEWIVEVLMVKMSINQERAAEVASWIASDAFRCPAMWLVRAIGFAMSQNRTYSARRDDTFDMTDAWAIPYVDAATVDRTMLDWISRAKRNLEHRQKPPYPYPHAFKSVKDLMSSVHRQLSL